MKTPFLSAVAIALVQVFCSGVGWASDQVVEKPVTADTPEKFAQVAVQIRAQMQADGRYEFIRPGDKAKVNTDLDTMAAMLRKSGSVAAMSENEKIQLFNTQEHLNGTLVHNDGNRLVCERRAPIGTNIPLNTCKTFAELEKERRDAKKYAQDYERSGWRCSGTAQKSNPSCRPGG
jgi:hypothetical protein